MTSRDVFFLWMGLVVGSLIRGIAAERRVERPTPEAAEQARKSQLTFLGFLSFIAAAALGLFDLVMFRQLTHSLGRWHNIFFPLILSMAATPALLAWLGFRLLGAARRPAPDDAERAERLRRAREAGAATRRAALDAVERTRGLRAAVVAVIPFAALVYAAMLAGCALYVIGRLLLGQDRWEPSHSTIIPGGAVASALLAWLGFRLLRGRDLRSEYAQAWDDVRALYPGTFDEGKPKPARDADLD